MVLKTNWPNDAHHDDLTNLVITNDYVIVFCHENRAWRLNNIDNEGVDHLVHRRHISGDTDVILTRNIVLLQEVMKRNLGTVISARG